MSFIRDLIGDRRNDRAVAQSEGGSGATQGPNKLRRMSYCPVRWTTNKSTVEGKDHTKHKCCMPVGHTNTNHLCEKPGCGSTDRNP